MTIVDLYEIGEAQAREVAPGHPDGPRRAAEAVDAVQRTYPDKSPVELAPLVIDAVRRRLRRLVRRNPAAEPFFSWDKCPAREDYGRLVETAVECLSPKDREIGRRLLHGYTVREIRATVKGSPRVVSARIRSIRQTLREAHQ